MTTTLKAEFRQKETKAKVLRGQGLLPAVIYGAGKDPEIVSLVTTDWLKFRRQNTDLNLINLSLAGQEVQVLIREVQSEAVSDQILHLDFQRVDAKVALVTEITINLTGEASAVKKGAEIVQSQSEIEVKCLPQDLIESFEVDISTLTEIGDSIRVSDLKIPAKIEVLTSLDNVVVQAVAHKEEVEEPVVSEVVEAEVEGEGEGEGEGAKEEADESSAEG